MNLDAREESKDISRELSSEARTDLLARYQHVRLETENLADPLTAEDMQLQSMADASPTKWHLAHTSWFFEVFILRPHFVDFRIFDSSYPTLFNSYYNSLGSAHSRPQRGFLSRPSIDQIFAYRDAVDQQIQQLIEKPSFNEHIASLILLGINHEQQHQELLLMDIKHALSLNPLMPCYLQEPVREEKNSAVTSMNWLSVGAGNYALGSDGEQFCFDNEQPPHQQFVADFKVASRTVCNSEYLEFIRDGGYREPRHWLSDGWDWVKCNQVSAPMYWRHREGVWWQFTLAGLQQLNPADPVFHLSFYEADAYARWAQKRLPTEFEWEIAACLHRTSDAFVSANMLEKGNYQPYAEITDKPQFIGSVWEWTGSAYLPYPGYRANADAIGEYNGKFMCNQMVLRGGSCITPLSHIRISYRNFFYPHQSWQFSGIRLAED
ncbi:MAG: ergothioneine biosynthesis protein EgtB [Gammaproteobacteria bacterium]|nr:ergothioneine biosynthesis protein EgtB [Gammaproteobacteria bacterium]